MPLNIELAQKFKNYRNVYNFLDYLKKTHKKKVFINSLTIHYDSYDPNVFKKQIQKHQNMLKNKNAAGIISKIINRDKNMYALAIISTNNLKGVRSSPLLEVDISAFQKISTEKFLTELIQTSAIVNDEVTINFDQMVMYMSNNHSSNDSMTISEYRFLDIIYTSLIDTEHIAKPYFYENKRIN